MPGQLRVQSQKGVPVSADLESLVTKNPDVLAIALCKKLVDLLRCQKSRVEERALLYEL